MANIEFDKNGRPIYWDGNSKWYDNYDYDVTSTKIANWAQSGDSNATIPIDSTGVKTVNIVFSVAYKNTPSDIFVQLKDATANDAVLGGYWISGESNAGFTLNVHVVTASATAGAKMSARYRAISN